MGMFDDLVPGQGATATQQAQPAGLFDDLIPKPKPMGKAANADFLKAELANADWGTRNIAAFGTALSDAWEGAKQLVGKGDIDRIRENKIIADSAPAGAITGNVALTALPFGVAGNGINAAAKVGTIMGALNPVDSDNTSDIVRGKIIGAATGGVTAAAGQGLANSVGSFFEKKAAAQALKQATNAPIDQTIKNAVDAGYVVTPTSVNPSWFNTLREGAGGKVATAQEASVRNAAVTDSLGRKALGLAEDAPLTSEAMQALRDKAYQSGYAPLEKAGRLNVSPEYLQGLDSITAGNSAAARSFPGAASPDIKALIEGYKPPTGSFDVGDALKATQVLRKEATAAYRVGNNEVGAAKRSISDELENEIERQLGASGQNGQELVQNFRDARKLMAKSHDVEDAIVEGGGSIDPRKLAAKFQRGAPLSDELATIGAFANNFPKAMQAPSKVAGPGASKLDIAMALAGGMTGYNAEGGPGGVVGTLLPLLASKGARVQMLSKGAQKALANRSYGLTAPQVAANRLAQYLPVGGAVLGRNALAQYLAP